MKGLELSKAYYEEYGKPMLAEKFPELMKYLAVGLVGSGSERYGFDDELSHDHDFEPAFCIFLPSEDVLDRRSAFQLERAYAKLPKEFMGYTRQPVSPVGGSRSGVIRTEDFYKAAVGAPDGELDMSAWLRIPDYALAEATNGEVFFDEYGEFSRIRQGLITMPRDVFLKRLAGNLLLMNQSGQYNYPRCAQRGEHEAAQLAANEFVNAALKAIFLLHGKYLPYYKWSFKALRALGTETNYSDRLSALLIGGLSEEEKYRIIEDVSADIIVELISRDITKASCGDLEKHAYSVNDFISDGTVRNLHILAAI